MCCDLSNWVNNSRWSRISRKNKVTSIFYCSYHRKCQQAVNDLGGKPNVLNWKLIDGNFKSVKGKWELSTTPGASKCAIIYTLIVDPGPIVPKFLVSFVLHNLQKEIILALQEWLETTKVSASAQS